MKLRLEIVYSTPNGIETFLHSSDLTVEEVITISEDMMNLNRVKEIKYIDSYDSAWTLKDLKKYVKDLEEEPHDIMLYFDGGFDHETLQSGLGCVIYYKQNGISYRIRKNALVSELETNNEAEYAALHFGLKHLEEMGVHHMPITIKGDSKVVINQLTDEWPCLEETLSQWIDRIEESLAILGTVPIYQVVSRKNNQEADQLATQALQNIEITSKIELA
ncbi:reverse transcriptase-like protein [Gracilibacillus xinjiangensis]|uniref:Reverse transcriptase-like protein n=1 Tax=Gracilibacillus xinjiangensis TaxID=1193282 RepID=A0ABV8WRL7_9BACI